MNRVDLPRDIRKNQELKAKTEGVELTIKWAQMSSPRGETRAGFWVLNHGIPVEETACFKTKAEAEEWVRSFNWW